MSAPRELGSSYTPSEIEPQVAARWAASDYGNPEGSDSVAKADLPPFTIIMPPPNVTGGLHVGHALFVTLEDLLARRARMEGATNALAPWR